MKITKEIIDKAFKYFDGTCPFEIVDGGECSYGSVKECQKCIDKKETDKNTINN